MNIRDVITSKLALFQRTVLTSSTSKPSWCSSLKSEYTTQFQQADLQHDVCLNWNSSVYFTTRDDKLKRHWLYQRHTVPMAFILYHEQLVVMTVYHWSCRNTLEAKSPMSCDMAQGEGLEPFNGLCGEAAGESGSPCCPNQLETCPTNHPPFITGLTVLPFQIWSLWCLKSVVYMLCLHSGCS